MGNHSAEYYRDYYKKNKEKISAYRKNYSKNVRYKNYTRIEAYIPKDDAKALKDKLYTDNLTIAEFIKNAVNEYINKKD